MRSWLEEKGGAEQGSKRVESSGMEGKRRVRLKKKNLRKRTIGGKKKPQKKAQRRN